MQQPFGAAQWNSSTALTLYLIDQPTSANDAYFSEGGALQCVRNF
jgi:hypothetical protein